jgi:hypothetical protein
MQFHAYTETLFQQISNLLQQLTMHQYSKGLPVLYGSSIGQHVRHVIEFFEEMGKGYKTGKVNYDNRKRNLVLEADKDAAIRSLNQVASSLNKKDKSLQLVVSYSPDEDQTCIVNTNYYREWANNIEHTVHHMALIKSGVQAFDTVQLPASFGIAVSTQKAQLVCVQ